MSVHAYPVTTVFADCVRAAAGLALVGVPLAVVKTAPVVTLVLAAGAAVFVVFGLRAIRHHLVRFELTEEGVLARGPAAATVSAGAVTWRDLEGLRLVYYSTRRDRSAGWLQLTLVGSGGRLTVDSRLPGFERLAAHAADAARQNRVRLDPTTLFNLEALGIVGPARSGPEPGRSGTGHA